MGRLLYEVNESYFDNIDTEEKAYFLGFLYADGYNNVERHEVKIRLSKIDEEILIKFRNALYPNQDRPLYYYRINEREYCELYISNSHISSILAKLGCGQAKTFNVSFPWFINNDLYHHFIRGVFDGDGCISCSTLKTGKNAGAHKTMFSIIGYEPFIKSINHIIATSCKLNENKLIRRKDKDSRLATMCYSGCNQCIIIRNYLYKNATIYLKRKYDKFFTLGTNEWRTIKNLKVNLYERTIKVTNTYNDPKEKIQTDYLICSNCGRRLNLQNKIYDKDSKIFCYKCMYSLFPMYIKRKSKGKIYDGTYVRKKDNIITTLNDRVSILHIKDIEVLFDTEDIDIVELYTWHIENNRVVCRVKKLKQCIYLNRLITNAESGQSVAFINGNTFDMRKENLEKRNHR